MPPVPLVMPVIVPDAEPMVNVAAAVLQIPPLTPSVAVICAPVHTVPNPDMGVGVAFTVITFVAEQPAAV